MIEFGCGDGNQLSLVRYPRYLGLDVSPHAVELCRERFSGDHTKEFRVLGEYAGETADLALSLDVLYHLVEDEVFDAHMRTLFAAGERFVIVFSTNAGRSNSAQPRARPAQEVHGLGGRACDRLDAARDRAQSASS